MDVLIDTILTMETAIQLINKKIKIQRRFNRGINISLAAMALSFIVINEINTIDFNQKIRRLREEIEELKHKKGA